MVATTQWANNEKPRIDNHNVKQLDLLFLDVIICFNLLRNEQSVHSIMLLLHVLNDIIDF